MRNPGTVLLTGGTGFLGSHLLDALITEGYSVILLKRSTSSLWRIEHLEGNFETFDVDSQPVEALFEKRRIDCVVHMATSYKKYDQPSDITEMIKTNVTLPSQILSLAEKYNVKGFINTGTFYELDCSVQPVSEAAPPMPFNFYARTKLAFEAILQSYSGSMSINTFKIFSPFGEKDNEKLIPHIIQNAVHGSPIKLSEGLQKIDLIYVTDIVSAYLLALTRWKTNGFKPEYEAFNLGSGVALSIRDVVSLIEASLKHEVKVEWGERSIRDISIAYADISKAGRMLNWYPKLGVKEGLSNTIRYYKDQGSQ